ncbi:MAG TPA: amylo-alpha-1,6-glucosidase [Syntrophales bacterium]|nr:amylo-alpha-1,6-glucosidase [Syntrophales bacterium]
MNIRFDERTILHLRKSLRLEWVDANGRGGYSSSTILHCHTRRYHGLLIANLKEPPGRHVLLSSLEDSIDREGKEIFLSFHRYPGVYYPHGYKYLSEFRLDLCPRFIYHLGEIRIRKSIMAVHAEDTVLIEYDCERGDIPLVLRIRPLIAYREIHALTRENLDLHVRTYEARNGFKIQPYDGMPPFFVQAGKKCDFYPSPVWYRDLEYMIDAERGFENHEDLFQAGVFEIPISQGEKVLVSGSLKEQKGSLRSIWDREEERRSGVLNHIEMWTGGIPDLNDKSLLSQLMEAGEKFIFRPSAGRRGIIAGYHWFYNWGRDTLISLPGLTFCCGRIEAGIEVLKSIGRFEKKGLLPNFISEDGKSVSYNSVDCALWYVWAVQQFLSYTKDYEILEKHFWPVVKRIVRRYMAGTENSIGMERNGLLHAGDSGTQLTWMDVMVDGKPVTPRNGLPVDINALWYNALCFAAETAETLEDSRFKLDRGLPDLVRNSFQEIFWMEEEGYLGDVWTEGRLDASVRPNQIFAVSLPHSPLESHHWRRVVDKVQRELLTPVGLRTLSPGDPAYHGRYAGSPRERDEAYHQGTVWPWLIGHFGEACLKAADCSDEARLFLLSILREMLPAQIESSGLGFLSEVYDGDPPHEPGGCAAQSWSVAEVIRLYTILISKEAPKFRI